MVPDHPTSHNGEDDSMKSYEPRIAPPGKETQKEGNDRSLPAHQPVVGINVSPVNETVIRQVTERQDSIEIGTPGKGGALKIYFDEGDLEGAETRVMNAFNVRELANRLSSPEPLSQRMSA